MAGLGPMGIAHHYLRAGDNGRAIDWLERAYEVHNPNLPYLGAPDYDPLRSDPRFQDLLCRMNLPMSGAGAADPEGS